MCARLLQAWRKVRESPKYKNRIAQVWGDEADHGRTNGSSSNGGGGGGGGGGRGTLARVPRRASKVRARGPVLPAQEEKRIREIVDSEVSVPPAEPRVKQAPVRLFCVVLLIYDYKTVPGIAQNAMPPA